MPRPGGLPEVLPRGTAGPARPRRWWTGRRRRRARRPRRLPAALRGVRPRGDRRVRAALAGCPARVRRAAGGRPGVVARALPRRGGRYDVAAEALGIGRSTLRHRLDRVRDLSGHDLSLPDTRFQLHLATKAWSTRRALSAG
ncbi:helix-turn-helix domain-containing protein [Phycicoccus sp. HDW14]|uniref:helix-turn-helix domain-containing protein n=1 Tax=Phycicoccus sp. HDW14 TaxID=2714941 RepID=UPI00140C3C26